ncbi:DUF1329 domain-containing protein [Burkholderia sp. R-69980]|nr:DUF1329 domain-containing protein [Burkholderia sp. R-69980]
MNKTLRIALAVAIALSAPFSYGAATADEAKQLGDTLTPVGATKAGNKEGTIPAWTGGLTSPPAGYTPKKEPGAYIDPFKDEKPLLRITGANASQYADKLSAGQMELLKRNSDYYLDIYPTHRTAAFPESVYEATKRNATACHTVKDGLAVETACRGGLPFPIPKTGNEVMWNLLLAYQPPQWVYNYGSYVVDTSGHPFVASRQNAYSEKGYYLGKERSDPQQYGFIYSTTLYPPRSKGEITGYADYLDPAAYPRKAFEFDPGQRRVKLAPSFAYDTPVAQVGGVLLFDEISLFSGEMDRFDFKLVGKKEMYIPYDSYKLNFQCTGEGQVTKAHTVNPGCERWELHRVWVVEATLKPNMRHTYSKRTYYIDEDTYSSGMSDAYDHSGQLYRSEFLYQVQIYDAAFPWEGAFSVYDFIKRNYTVQSMLSPTGYLDFKSKAPNERDLTPDALAGSGND